MTSTIVADQEDTRRVGTSRIMIVDDHRAFADLLALALGTQPDLDCVGVASSGAQGVAMAVELRPDIAVLDIEMPRQDGLAAARRITELVPEALVVIVSAHRGQEWVGRAARAGASAFVPKDSPLADILDILRRVRHGSMLVAPTAYHGGCDAVPLPDDGPVPALTEREREVLGWLVRGAAPKEIARTLGISIHTSRSYVKSLHTKFAVDSRVALVMKAQRLRLVDGLT